MRIPEVNPINGVYRPACRRRLAEKSTGDRYVALVISPSVASSLIVGVTIVLWATSLLPEFITALLFLRRR
jgi:hypothetical protein